MAALAVLPRIGKIDQRAAFWRYCIYASNGAVMRAKKAGLPYLIDSYFIDRLLVDQGWRCAVSGIDLTLVGEREAFGPSLDRIEPSRGYVPGNLRIVCNMVNCAMNTWGEDAFRVLVARIKDQPSPFRSPGPTP